MQLNETAEMQDITAELNEAIKLAEKLNDILLNLSHDIDEDSRLNPPSINAFAELKAMFKVTATSNGILDHLEALNENIIL